MTNRRRRPIPIVIALALLSSCRGEPATPEGAEPASPGMEQEEAPPAAGGGTVHEYAYLTPAAEALVRFLQGGAEPDAALLADTVTLIVAPEGGGDRRRVAGETLLQREQWRVGGRSLVPPAGVGHLTLLPGLHASCRPVPLESRAPELGAQPHVGVRLATAEDADCLQTWTITFVFGGSAEAPRLVAALYDQWEW